MAPAIYAFHKKKSFQGRQDEPLPMYAMSPNPF